MILSSRSLIAMIALLVLSACVPTTDQTAWENVHDGFLIGNIYMGDGSL